VRTQEQKSQSGDTKPGLHGRLATGREERRPKRATRRLMFWSIGRAGRRVRVDARAKRLSFIHRHRHLLAILVAVYVPCALFVFWAVERMWHSAGIFTLGAATVGLVWMLWSFVTQLDGQQPFFHGADAERETSVSLRALKACGGLRSSALPMRPLVPTTQSPSRGAAEVRSSPAAPMWCDREGVVPCRLVRLERSLGPEGSGEACVLPRLGVRLARVVRRIHDARGTHSEPGG